MPKEAEKSAQLDRLHTALAADDRRAVLRYLHSSEGDGASRDELVAFQGSRDGQPDNQEQIALRLHHVILPTLADAGLLDYDAPTATVQYDGDPLQSEWLDREAECRDRAGR